jgi:predicted permease
MRTILKNWRLSAIAAFSLTVAMALGIVAFAISDVLLLRPPMAKNPRELVAIFSSTPKEPFGRISFPDYEYYRDNNRVFTDVAAYPNSINVTAGTFENRVAIVSGCPVSDNYFSVMGIQPLAGRFFEKGDDRKRTPVVVLTYAGWTRFNRDPEIIGKKIYYGRDGMTIIGITPEKFKGAAFGVEPDIITHFDLNDDDRRRENTRLILLGRLRPRVSPEQAQVEIRALSRQLAQAYPREDADRVAGIKPAGTQAPDNAADARMFSELLIIAIFFVLLIACANAANLLLAIATGRRREALIKVALGASRGRLIREFLLETGALCVFSAICGFALAWLAIAKLSEFETRLPGFGRLRLAADLHADGAVFAACVVMVLIASVATGIAPALYGSSVDLASALTGEIVIGGTKKGVIRNGLVIVQVAVSTLVLIGVALCYRSLHNLRSVDVGFSARNLAGVLVGANDDAFNDSKAPEFYAHLRDAASQIPGVEAVALSSGMPLQLGGADADARTDDRSQIPLRIHGGFVDGNYFSTAQIRLLSGRTFNRLDTEKTPEVMIVSKEMARRLWPGSDPVGRSILLGNGSRAARVVAVAADVKISDLDETPQPFMYFALAQHPRPYITVVVRTAGDPRLWVEPLARAMIGLDVRLPVPPMTLDDVIDLTVLFSTWVLDAVSAVSALALLLATLGLFGAVSYSVGERKRELGIRMALGALPSHLIRMILKNTLVVAGSGVAIGVVLGVVATILLRSRFFAIHRIEWMALWPVAIAMLALASLIAYFAARPARQLDPMQVLRHH